MKTFKTVKSNLLEGRTVSHDNWSIVVNSDDKVLTRDPAGNIRTSSFVFLDSAVSDFCKAAGIPEKVPAPKKYPAVQKGVIGPDTSTNEAFKAPKVVKQPVMQGKTPEKGLGSDTSLNDAFKSPAVNKRPQPQIGRGGLTDTDLGPDSSTREPKFARKKKAQAAEDTQYMLSVLEEYLGPEKLLEEIMSEISSEEMNDIIDYISDKYEVPPGEEGHSDRNWYMLNTLEEYMGSESVLEEVMKSLSSDSAYAIVEYIARKFDIPWESKPESKTDDAFRSAKSKRSAKFVDTFSTPKAGKSYSQLVNESPSDRLLDDLMSPDKWAANRLADMLDEDFEDDDEENVISCSGKPKKAQSTENSQYMLSVLEEYLGSEKLLEEVMSEISSEEMNDIIDYISDKYEVPPGEEGHSDRNWYMLNTLEEYMGSESVLEEVMKSLSSDSMYAIVEYIARKFDIAWEEKPESKTDDAFRSAKSKQSVKLKENWGDSGAYGRDIEAETPEELYHLVRSFGSDDEYDWSGMTPRQPGQVTEEEAGVTAKSKQSADESAKDYWESYFGEYGKDLTDDAGTDVKPVKKDKSITDENRGNKGEGDSAKVYEPKVEQSPKPFQQQSVGKNPIKAQAAPEAAPAPAPAAPVQAPAKAPAAPGQAPKAPATPAKPSTGAGDEGLKTLGWTDQDIMGMQPDQKQKIIQVQLQKPGTTPGQNAEPVPVKPAQPATPPKTPAAPVQSPAAPVSPSAPVAARVMREASDAGKVRKAFRRLVKNAQDEMATPVPASPANPATTAPATPAPATPGQAPGKSVLDSGTPEAKVYDIYKEVVRTQVPVISGKEIAVEKAALFTQRVMEEVGMTSDEVKQLFGVDNLMNLFKN